MAEKTVPVPSGPERKQHDREMTRARERHLPPPVDIYETSDALVMMVDLPGVSKDGLEVRVDDNVLTIRGKAVHVVPGEAIYREYDLANFFRQFELSEVIDQEKIIAELVHGVLTLRLPKAKKAKPRQIEVRVS